MMSEPYKACFTSKNTEPYVYGIHGPGEGLGYYAWLLYPQNTFTTFEDAEKAARLMNLAYGQGKREKAKELRAVLELDK